MKNNKIKNLILLIVLGVVFTGCNQKQPEPIKKMEIKKEKFSKKKSYAKNNYPILKQNNLGQRAVVDMGIVLKATILNYKDRQNNLIATHDVFFWAKKPDFITTNTIPKKRINLDSPGVPINLNLEGVVDLEKSVSQEKIRTKNNNESDKKILEFLQKEMEKGK